MSRKKNAPIKTGRPSKYSAAYAPKIAELAARHGMIDEDMAAYMGISKTTLNNWKNEYPDFREAIERGKKEIDDRVESALAQRALGYEHPEDAIMQYKGEPVIVPTIKHYPPDTVACIFWLKNRRPDIWRDRQEVLNTYDDSAMQLAEAIKNLT